MTRTNRIAVFAAIALAILVGGTVFAQGRPTPQAEPAPLGQDGEEVEAPPTAEEIAHAAERLTAARVPFTDDQLNDLAGRFGIGGAVRLLAWANEGHDLQTLIGRREVDGMGWGQIAKEFDVHPGVGSIMGNGGGNGGGHGRDNAPGQQGDGDE